MTAVQESTQNVDFKTGKPAVPAKLTLPGPSGAPVVAGVVLTHGAGGDMDSGHLPRLAASLAAAGVACVRFTCRTLHLPTRVAAFQAVLWAAGSWRETAAIRAWVCAGHSMGGRAACQVAHDNWKQQHRQREGEEEERQLDPLLLRKGKEEERQQPVGGLRRGLRQAQDRQQQHQQQAPSKEGKRCRRCVDGDGDAYGDAGSPGGDGDSSGGVGGSGGGGRSHRGGAAAGATARAVAAPAALRKCGASAVGAAEDGSDGLAREQSAGAVPPAREMRSSGKRRRVPAAAARGPIMESVAPGSAPATCVDAAGGGAGGRGGHSRGDAKRRGAPCAAEASGGSCSAAGAAAAAAAVAAAGSVPRVAGCVLLSYPLHPPDKPEQLRDEPLCRLRCPVLFVRGGRDEFSRPELFAAVLARMRTSSPDVQVHEVEGGDHGLNVALPRGRRRRRGADGGDAGEDPPADDAVEGAISAVAAFVRDAVRKNG